MKKGLTTQRDKPHRAISQNRQKHNKVDIKGDIYEHTRLPWFHLLCPEKIEIAPASLSGRGLNGPEPCPNGFKASLDEAFGEWEIGWEGICGNNAER